MNPGKMAWLWATSSEINFHFLSAGNIMLQEKPQLHKFTYESCTSFSAPGKDFIANFPK